MPERIITAVTTMASSETLRIGQRLPAVRDLAALLSVSPSTVSTAYHALARSGVVSTRGRSGTVILPQTPAASGPASAAERASHAMADTGPVVDLSRGTPDPTLLPDIRPFMIRLGHRKAFVNSYNGPTILPLLEAVLRRTWPYDPEAMTMVSGAGDGLSLCVDSFVRPGDIVITETPTYPPLLELIRRAGAITLGIPMDSAGMLPERLAATMERLSTSRGMLSHHPVRLILLQPRAQNPTGASMDRDRIKSLAAVVRARNDMLKGQEKGSGMVIVEDDHSGDISSAFPVSLGEFLPDDVIHIRSFSKSYGPDLRLAALSGPRRLVDAIIDRRRPGAGWVSRFLQEILHDMLSDGRIYATITTARRAYARRRGTMERLLDERGIRIAPGDGFNIWLPSHDPMAVQELSRRRIRVAEGSFFLPDVEGPSSPDRDDPVRLCSGGDRGGFRLTVTPEAVAHGNVADAVAEVLVPQQEPDSGGTENQDAAPATAGSTVQPTVRRPGEHAC
ncbi:aminotransferase class I/II-fold pyridoxal phosphate-dependent enzyme [uncultured Bifidobacterium sp.]|uniref:aminotransferase-like domain-containing protein n=1 Tax=uncultured Bifidobacterium sp. TaxID=165187 RepID=UPI0028DB0CD9|nr:aminotransferase class I/II-fold pyridoxal phosphate-dependent enzyme [uncultured Bifidobacterium sp.]